MLENSLTSRLLVNTLSSNIAYILYLVATRLIMRKLPSAPLVTCSPCLDPLRSLLGPVLGVYLVSRVAALCLVQSKSSPFSWVNMQMGSSSKLQWNSPVLEKGIPGYMNPSRQYKEDPRTNTNLFKDPNDVFRRITWKMRPVPFMLGISAVFGQFNTGEYKLKPVAWTKCREKLDFFHNRIITTKTFQKLLFLSHTLITNKDSQSKSSMSFENWTGNICR